MKITLDTNEATELEALLEEEIATCNAQLDSWAGGPNYRNQDYTNIEIRKDSLGRILLKIHEAREKQGKFIADFGDGNIIMSKKPR